MKRCITIGIIIIICFLCQTTVFHFLELSGVVPNLLLIVTMSFGLMRGRREGLLVGFFSGILVDIFLIHGLGCLNKKRTITRLKKNIYKDEEVLKID